MNQRKGQGEGEDIQGGGEQILELDGDWRENGGRGRIILHWERIEISGQIVLATLVQLPSLFAHAIFPELYTEKHVY